MSFFHISTCCFRFHPPKSICLFVMLHLVQRCPKWGGGEGNPTQPSEFFDFSWKNSCILLWLLRIFLLFFLTNFAKTVDPPLRKSELFSQTFSRFFFCFAHTFYKSGRSTLKISQNLKSFWIGHLNRRPPSPSFLRSLKANNPLRSVLCNL
jgi:hypothetical protein